MPPRRAGVLTSTRPAGMRPNAATASGVVGVYHRAVSQPSVAHDAFGERDPRLAVRHRVPREHRSQLLRGEGMPAADAFRLADQDPGAGRHADVGERGETRGGLADVRHHRRAVAFRRGPGRGVPPPPWCRSRPRAASSRCAGSERCRHPRSPPARQRRRCRNRSSSRPRSARRPRPDPIGPKRERTPARCPVPPREWACCWSRRRAPSQHRRSPSPPKCGGGA